MPKRLNREQLNRLFVEGLGSAVEKVKDISEKPLLIDLKPPYPLKLRVYIYNCTNPPGGRAPDEYKIQVIVPGQERGARSQFDYSDGRLALLAAYVRMSETVDSGVFVLWDASKHQEFSYSANVQVKTETIIEALCIPVAEGIRNNDEIILAAQQKHLLAAIKRRVEIMGREVREETQWD